MAAPFLTVVIPVYQVEKYLKRCVDSVLAQNYKNYEVILVDDGSMDRSPEICDQYAEEFDQIQVIHKENGGLSDARNTGIEMAKGKYILFIDSDDWIGLTCFESLMPILEKGDFDLLCFGRQFVKSENESLTEVLNPETRIVTGYEAFLEMLQHGLVTGFATDKIFKKSLFKDNAIEFPVGHYYEDLGVLYRILLSSKQALLSNQVFYHYFIDNPNAITASWTEKKFRNMFEFYRDVHHSPIVLENMRKIDQSLVDAYYVNGMVYILSILYKTGLDKKYMDIVGELKEALKSTDVSLASMKFQPNYFKYLLYRLGTLKPVFRLRKILS